MQTKPLTDPLQYTVRIGWRKAKQGNPIQIQHFIFRTNTVAL